MAFSFGRIKIGSFGNNVIAGTDRRDIILGLFGDDEIDARGGNDNVLAGFGDDTVIGGAGNDTLSGGFGFDTAVYSGRVEDYTITTRGWFGRQVTVEGNGEGRDRLTGFEAIRFDGDGVTFRIDGANNAALARADSLSTDEDRALRFAAADLLANDFDFDGDALSVTAVSATSAAGATVTLSNGQVVYDPGSLFEALGAGETATDTFTYIVTDSRGATSEATVTVTIAGVNDAPVVSAMDVTIDENTVLVPAAVSASDVDGDGLTFSLSGADAALFEIDAATGALSFVAAPDFEMPGDSGGDNVYDVTVTVDDGNGGSDSVDIVVSVADVAELAPLVARINEIHYDNDGADTGEFVEIRVAAGTDPARLSLVAYNGNGGTVYATYPLPSTPASGDGTHDYYVVNTPGLQNGAPDGLALVGDGAVVEFLSYEGSFTALGGAADGLTSTDIGVAEGGDTPAGQSLQRNEDGTWRGPEAETRGADNDALPAIEARLNEIHYDNEGTDAGEFVEVRVTAGADASTLVVTLYNGSNGTAYDTLSLPGSPASSDAAWDYYLLELPTNGIQNGAPDGIALSGSSGLIEFLSYEGAFTAADGPADGVVSTDIGVFEPDDTPVGQSLQRNEDGTWRGPEAETRGAANDGVEPPAFDGRINEFHYDNAGSDTGEFIEIRVAAGTDVSGTEIVLYNGSNGASYDTLTLAGPPASSTAAHDYYVIELPQNGLQNGSPDGIALFDDGALVEFLSYEGSFTAQSGQALGATAMDIGVAEDGTTPAGFSLQRDASGNWAAPAPETRGAPNAVAPTEPVFNELRVSSGGSSDDTSNFVELLGIPGQDFSGLTLLAVSGEFAPGQVDFAVSLDGAVADENGFLLIAEASNPALGTGDVGVGGLDFFGSPQSFLLVRDFAGAQDDDLDADDDGVFDAPLDIVAAGPSLIDGDDTPDVSYTSDVFGPDGAFTPAGLARQTDGTGAFVPLAFGDAASDTPGRSNEGILPPPGGLVTISSIQGSGPVAARFNQQVTVEAVVTMVLDNGFFLQEEDADQDGDDATSEGIFVFAGGSDLPSLGDRVSVSGTVDEFNGETQIDSVTNVTVLASDMALPTPAEIGLSPATNQDFEAVEGMRVEIVSGTEDPLTVITNFNFDRFGELVVSSGLQFQPTQLFDPETQQAEIQALIAANAANQITISEGLDGQNPTRFPSVPAATGDDGDGILDVEDDFTEAGPTIRLGSEILGNITGVMDFGSNSNFDDPAFKVIPDAPLNIDQATNEGARQSSPDPVGGTLQVAGFNVLNYFTTLQDSGDRVGPNNLEPRGADDQTDLDRQTAKLVDAALATGAEVFALQELENGGFGDGSAIATFVDALNAEAAERGGSQVYAFVDPTAPGDSGFIGTDAITTGIIYDTSAVSLVTADTLVFEEASAGETFATASVLSAEVGNDIGDFQRNRPAVAATFEDLASGETFTVASVHFKSKGDSGLQSLAEAAQTAVDDGRTALTQADVDALLADPNFDQGDGQGFWNGVRSDAAAELDAWFDAGSGGDLYAGTGAEDVLVIGDFNAYARERPTQTFAADPDYVDLIDRFVGQEDAYSFVFDGQRGTLDQAIASDSLADWVTGLTEWHINADEPDLLNYNSRFTDARFYAEGPFASSDHDPVIVGLDPTLAGTDLFG